MAGWVQMAAQGVGSMFTAYGQYTEGKRQDEIAKSDALQLKAAGNAEYGKKTREAHELKRATEVAASNARAAQAASGGVTTDAQAVDQLAEIRRDGEHNVLNAMFEGKSIQQDYQNQATFRRYEGKLAKYTGKLAAIGTLLSMGNSMAKTYNDNKKPVVDTKKTTTTNASPQNTSNTGGGSDMTSSRSGGSTGFGFM